MKKFYFFIFIMIFASLIFVSCVDNTYNLALNNLSEIRNQILIAEDEDIYMTFMSGKREKDYNLDGVSNELIDFSIINLYFKDKNYEYNEKKVEYSLTIDETLYSGEMINNPYDNSFVIDLGLLVDELNSLDITIKVNEESKTYTLNNISKAWKYSNEKALETVCKDLKDYLQQEIKDNKLNAEVVIKIVYNNDLSDTYYWYVQIVTINGNTYTELVNPQTNEILAKNIS